MLAMVDAASRSQGTALARRRAPYYSGLVRQRRSLRRGASSPRAAGGRRRWWPAGAEHRDLLVPDRHLAGRGAAARNRLRELLRDLGLRVGVRDRLPSPQLHSPALRAVSAVGGVR